MNSDGTRIAVGAPGKDVGANANQGAAYVYLRSGSVWTLEQKITTLNGAVNDQLGSSEAEISADGTRLFVDASRKRVSGRRNQGSVYVFSRSGTNWTQENEFIAADGKANDNFGSSFQCSLDATRLAIGAPQNYSNYNTGPGAVYAYARTGTAWSLEQKITAPDGVIDDTFGGGVRMTGDGSRMKRSGRCMGRILSL
jgi:hypothetical protein